MSIHMRNQPNCLVRPIGASIIGGSLFTAFDLITQGGGLRSIPRRFGIYAGGVYVYNILQCPMEAIHGRQSSFHNVISGAMLGYIGVSRRLLGIPFIDPFFFYRNPHISPPLAGAFVYGVMGGFLSSLAGKPFWGEIVVDRKQSCFCAYP